MFGLFAGDIYSVPTLWRGRRDLNPRAWFRRLLPEQGSPFGHLGTSAYGMKKLAERVGFEPTDAFASPVFKTGAFNHSAISPCAQKHDRLKRRTYSTTLRAACQRICELPGMFFCSLSRERRKKGRERLYKPPVLCYTVYKPWSIHGLFVCCAGPMGPCVHV